jgi:prephenate dehydrogenase
MRPRTRDVRPDDAVGIVGLGLVGGSLAKALRRRFPRRVLIAVEPNAKTRSLARCDRLFEVLSPRPSSALSRCSIVVLCAPIDDVLHLIGPVSARMRDGAILTDVAGVKEPVLEAAPSRVRPGITFVGTHPMLGGESGGYAGSRGDLWKGGTVAVCTDGAAKRAVSEVVRLHRALGARVVLCTAVEHDAAAAAISHLPYLLASALALTARGAGALARRLSARGLADATRLAAFPYDVQGEAARRNTHLVHAVRSFGGNLRGLLDTLAASPAAARIAFGRARAAKASLVAAPLRSRRA